MQPSLSGPRYFNPVNFIRWMLDPTAFYRATRERYGDTYKLPTVFGPLIITSDPEGIRAMFTADADTFVPYQPNAVSPFLGDTSLVLVSGARHKRDRRLLSPPFHGARMRAYGTIMAESAQRAAAAWVKGVPFKMMDTTQHISLDVILQAVFGLDHASPRGQAVREAVSQFVGSIRPLFIFFSWMRRDFFGWSS